MKNKRYLISGASSGIGYQIAFDILSQGGSVVGVSRHKSDKITSLLERYPENFFFKQKDLSEDIDGLSKWVIGLSKEIGRFSGFVHSAGIQQILPLQTNSYKKMLEVFNLNLFSGLSIAKGIADRRVNIGEGTSVVFLSSIASITGASGLINYSASKASLNGAMRAMAAELAPLKIRVNTVLPGFIETEMIEKWKDVYSEEYIQKIHDTCPLGVGTAKDVSNMVCFLLSEQSNWITGNEFNVDGGNSLGGF